MYLQYLGAVFARALRPTVRITDGLQILAASFVALGARLAGVKMTDDIATNILAYVGMAVTALIVIRLFWAPYSIWKDQLADSAGLRLELSRPERLELEHKASQSATDRRQGARLLADIHAYFLTFHYDGKAGMKGWKKPTKAVQELWRIEMTYFERFWSHRYLVEFIKICAKIEESRSTDEDVKRLSELLLILLWQVTLRSKGEGRLPQLPPSTVPKTRP